MKRKYDGCIAKDKHGDYWLGTFGPDKETVECHIRGLDSVKLKIVKVKFVEVKGEGKE